MAWPSSRSAQRVLALVLLPLALPGCWTGHLLESARRRESSLRYERAFRAGDRLYVEYEVAIRDREGQELGRAERWAALTLADLERRPELPIDELPVEFAPRSVPDAAEPVPLLRGEHPAPPGAALVLRVAPGTEREAGLALETPGAAAPPARLHSGSLTRDRTAPWVWPLVPVSLALDAAVLPLHALAIAFFYLTPE